VTFYLSSSELLTLAASNDPRARLADRGILDAAAIRPASVDEQGRDVYPGLLDKAAALFQAIITFGPLVSGNESFAMEAARVFLYLNGLRLGRADAETGMALAEDVAAERTTDVAVIARRLRGLLG
jgi:death on curing protein